MTVILTPSDVERLLDRQATDIGDQFRVEKTHCLALYPVMSGAMYYAPALLRKLRGVGLEVEIIKDLFTHRGMPKPVLIVDTIYDTGLTAQRLLDDARRAGWWTKIYFSFLVHKKLAPQTSLHHGAIVLAAGVEVPESHVFGYGLDDKMGLWRELPYIRV